VFQGRVEQARLETDWIRVRGRGALEISTWVTRHGPLIETSPAESLALRWTAADAGAFQFPFLDINRAKNWTEFTAALARFPGPAQNFVYADIDGNIGYHAAGQLPVRKGYSGDVPSDGASGNFEWQGYIPFDQLPSAYNPPGGMIVTANQNPFPADFAYPVNGNFAPPYRSARIRSLLAAKKGWRAADMLPVQTDVYSAFSHDLARAAVAAYLKRKSNNPALNEAVEMLKAWDGRMEKDRAEPLLATLVFQYLRKAAVESAAPRAAVVYENPVASAAIGRLLRERPGGWFRDYDEILVRALSDAVEEGARIQGRDVKRWRYGSYVELTVPHPIGRRMPWIGKYFGIGPVWQSGSQTTVKQTTRRLGPSMRLVADLGDLENSLLNIATGQSGQILSRHYNDQWPGHLEGTSRPMQFRRVTPRGTLRFVPEGK
jgi:penicillin amidase